MKNKLIKKLALSITPRVVSFLGNTTRLKQYPGEFHRVHGEKSQPFIAVYWHSRLLFITWYLRVYPLCAMISRHSDGALAADTFGKFGIKAVRGSTSSGGAAAFRQLFRMIEQGWNAAITPDGPRGPSRRLQEGVISLGQISQRPIIPISFSARHAVRLKSWDRFMVPLPFSRVSLVYGEPILIPRKMDTVTKEKYRLSVEEALNRVTDLSDELVGQEKM